MGKFVIFKDNKSEFRFNLKANNDEIILHSEGYSSKQGCQNGIVSVKQNSPYDERYLRKSASNGQYYFVLTAKNNETIGVSEMYVSSQGRDNGIESVKVNAPSALIEDLT
jgi:hypothetical protein